MVVTPTNPHLDSLPATPPFRPPLPSPSPPPFFLSSLHTVKRLGASGIFLFRVLIFIHLHISPPLPPPRSLFLSPTPETQPPPPSSSPLPPVLLPPPLISSPLCIVARWGELGVPRPCGLGWGGGEEEEEEEEGGRPNPHHAV